LVHRGDPAAVFAAADAAVAKSGTTTLEAALAGVPMVVVYRPAWLTAQLAPRLLKVEWISLVNLIAGRTVVPEFWRWPVRAAAVAEAVRPLLRAGPERAAQLEGFAVVRSRLGSNGAAGRVADLALSLLQQ
jgi:lipid-A-disaccharide synthase